MRVGKSTAQGPVDSYVVGMRTHPKFVLEAGQLKFDIAVLEVSPHLENVQPVQLCTGKSIPVGSEAFAAGYGKCVDMGSTDRTQRFSIKHRFTGTGNCPITGRHFIFGHRHFGNSNYNRICPGDSGGPLFMYGEKMTSMVQVSIVSSACAVPCCCTGDLVSGHIGWIKAQVKGDISTTSWISTK